MSKSRCCIFQLRRCVFSSYKSQAMMTAHESYHKNASTLTSPSPSRRRAGVPVLATTSSLAGKDSRIFSHVNPRSSFHAKVNDVWGGCRDAPRGSLARGVGDPSEEAPPLPRVRRSRSRPCSNSTRRTGGPASPARTNRCTRGSTPVSSSSSARARTMIAPASSPDPARAGIPSRGSRSSGCDRSAAPLASRRTRRRGSRTLHRILTVVSYTLTWHRTPRHQAGEHTFRNSRWALSHQDCRLGPRLEARREGAADGRSSLSSRKRSRTCCATCGLWASRPTCSYPPSNGNGRDKAYVKVRRGRYSFPQPGRSGRRAEARDFVRQLCIAGVLERIGPSPICTYVFMYDTAHM